MRATLRLWTATGVLVVFAHSVASQPAPPPPARPAPPQNVPPVTPPPPARTAPPVTVPTAVVVPTTPPVPNTVAATVNGQPIMEVAIQRGLQRVPPDKVAQFREQILSILIDNTLLDQMMSQLQIVADPKDVEAKLKELRDEIQKEGSTFDKVLRDKMLTEAELRGEISGLLRWEKYVAGQANDAVLRDHFDKNRDLFDGTMVRARHILLVPPAGDARASEQTKARLAELKKQLDAAVAQSLAKLPPAADNLAREKQRSKLLDDAFAALAGKESMCPSKAQGGDLGFFPRAGSMVEPFANAAFALRPYQMSDVVSTQFGYHLILVTERRQGKAIKFEDVKDEVRDYFGFRLRESVTARLRPAAKIVVNPPPR